MAIIVAAALVAAAVFVAAERIARARIAHGSDRSVDPLAIVGLFAPGLTAVESNPRALLVWQPLAHLARRLYPDAFAALDTAAGGTFPFTREQILSAHARWTADWLSWEQGHDTEFRRKAAVLERELAAGDSAVARARLEAVEREKLETYQQRYQEYVRVAKALQALTDR